MSEFIDGVLWVVSFIVLLAQYTLFIAYFASAPETTKREFRNGIVPFWGACFFILEYYNKLGGK